ncbi:hypothetical protein FXO37_19466 [Capsicum annuum]|nr:hypothetical protein FXO37_19466 [Capsicum annuum]
MQQLHSLILASESNVYKFYSLWKKDVKEVVMESSDPPCDFDSSCFGQSVQGWMSYIRHKDCQFFLFNLLSGKKINLPSVETIPSVVRVIRNSQSGWVESLVLDHSPEPQTPQRCSEDLDLIVDVVLSSSPMDDDCIVVVIYGCQQKLAFCRRIRRDDADHPNCWIPCYFMVFSAMNTFRIHESLENRSLLTFSLKRLPLRPHIGDF